MCTNILALQLDEPDSLANPMLLEVVECWADSSVMESVLPMRPRYMKILLTDIANIPEARYEDPATLKDIMNEYW